jgi:hypothetical protein
LFFLTPADADQRHVMMVVPVETRDGLRVGPPRSLFGFHQLDLRFACVPARCYDVKPDGQGFFGVQTIPPQPVAPVTHIQLVQNWAEEVKAKVPTGK